MKITPKKNEPKQEVKQELKQEIKLEIKHQKIVPTDNQQIKKTKKNDKDINNKQNYEKQNFMHDMRDNALGQMYKTPGANLDYDEINKMADNHIRDADELVAESLQNKGLEIEKMQHAMEGYVKKGDPELHEIKQMSQKVAPDVVAMAYTNVAKNAGRNDLMRLTIIDEKLDFEQPKFEAAFDQIRHFDKEADRVLDWLDAEIGRER